MSDHSEAIVYGKNFELAPGETVTQEAVAPNQPYRIELELDGEGPGDTYISYHHHYRPFHKEHIDLRIKVDLRQDGVEFFDTFGVTIPFAFQASGTSAVIGIVFLWSLSALPVGLISLLFIVSAWNTEKFLSRIG